jgi:hypothetical protein
MSDDSRDRITILAKDFTSAAMEYHRREMGKKGYRIDGPIEKSAFFVIEGFEAPKPLVEGEYFAVTFVRG